MARPRKYEEPIESYALKLSPKHIFALKLIARTGEPQSEGTVLAEAIENIADRLKLSRHWSDVWSQQPGVAWLNAYALPEYTPIRKEMPRVEFVRAHKQFFYRDDAATVPNTENATILWEQVDGLATEWMKHRKTDYWGVAKKMSAMLKRAKLPSPSFGATTSPASKASAARSGKSDTASRSSPGKGAHDK